MFFGLKKVVTLLALTLFSVDGAPQENSSKHFLFFMHYRLKSTITFLHVIIFVTLFFDCLENEAPKFHVVTSRSIEEPPTIHVTFANGLHDDFDLRHYKMNKVAPIGCNYIGHLREDPSSSIAVTGCLNNPEDRLQVTLNSRNSINKMFKVDSFGNVEIVRSPFQDGGKISLWLFHS